MGSYVAPGVWEIDTRLGGWDRVTAGYLVEGPAPVLVETGAQSSVSVLLSELAAHGVGPTDLAGVAVTHIHLDHAGGVGDVAAAFPAATVYVHSRGARHLADPARLVASAATVYGPLLDSLYGRLSPTDASRIHVLEDGESISVGDWRELTAIYSPGHAKHHLALLDSESGLVFAGDAVGVRLPDVGVIRPATPPADFDLDQAVESLHKLQALRPVGVALAHYGLLPEPLPMLEEAEEELLKWAGVAERAWSQGQDVEAALRASFGAAQPADGTAVERMEALNGIHSNAAGLRLWLSRTRGDPGVSGGSGVSGTSGVG